jgi:hypothetical protein
MRWVKRTPCAAATGDHARSPPAKHQIRVIAQFAFDDSVTRIAMAHRVTTPASRT